MLKSFRTSKIYLQGFFTQTFGHPTYNTIPIAYLQYFLPRFVFWTYVRWEAHGNRFPLAAVCCISEDGLVSEDLSP